MADPSQTPPASSPQPQEPTPPLNYLSPRHDPERDAAETTRAFFGGILTFLTLFALVVIWIISRLSRMRVGIATAPASSPPLSARWLIIATIAALVFLGGIAFFQYRRHHSTAFARGILIGIGFTVCVAGLCYLIKG